MNTNNMYHRTGTAGAQPGCPLPATAPSSQKKFWGRLLFPFTAPIVDRVEKEAARVVVDWGLDY